MKCDELLGECVGVLCDSGVDHTLLEELAKHPDSQERLKGIERGEGEIGVEKE